MKIDIVCVGKLKEKYLLEAQKEYIKRITPYATVNIIELPDEKAPEKLSPAQVLQVMEKEGERIGKYLTDNSYKIALAIKGKMLTSEALAETVDKLTVSGFSKFVFIIGGSNGLCQKVLDKCQLHLSFSKMTFPHQLMRVVLLEQVYRSFKILANEPYHK